MKILVAILLCALIVNVVIALAHLITLVHLKDLDNYLINP